MKNYNILYFMRTPTLQGVVKIISFEPEILYRGRSIILKYYTSLKNMQGC